MCFSNELGLTFASSFAGMSELVKERPENPVEYLASYLLQHDPKKKTGMPTGGR
jgi:hypothetical protein